MRDATPDLLRRFRDYLVHQAGNSHNTVVENLKIVSQLLREAGVSHDPCGSMPLSREATPRGYLLEEELDRMMALKLKPGSEAAVVRDMFYVACRTGLRISDLLQLRWENMAEGLLRIRMQKTGRWVEVPATPGVMAVLESYRNLFSDRKTYVFPLLREAAQREGDFAQARDLVYATARFNLAIKKVATKAGIGKNLSSHMGRHTFATMLINKGASIYEVNELLGHRDVKVTQVYAHLMDCRKHELVAMLE